MSPVTSAIALTLASAAITNSTGNVVHWYAYSSTANSITGDLTITNSRVKMGKHVFGTSTPHRMHSFQGDYDPPHDPQRRAVQPPQNPVLPRLDFRTCYLLAW